MSKTHINTMITHMKKAGIITKVSPWLFENGSDTRYVGINNDWQEIMSSSNNILLKFLVINKEAFIEVYLANKPPFVGLHRQKITKESEWKLILGELKRTLNKDKQDYQVGKPTINNLYVKILPSIKK